MARVCVGALVVRRDGEPRILLGQRAADRAFFPDVWDIPGGHCEPGETPKRTLVRELQEEIGVTPTAWRALGELEGPIPGGAERLVLHLYVVTAWTGVPHNRQPVEHARIAWVAIDDAYRLPLAHPSFPELFRRAASSTA